MSKLISKKMNNWLLSAQSCVYPYTCFICDQPGHNAIDLCSACLAELPRIEQACTICNIALTTDSRICGRCIKDTPYFDRISTPYRYHGTARFLIQSLKFQAKHSCAKIMGELMVRHIKALDSRPDALISVPLHPKRLAVRGFNQSDFISQWLQQDLQIPVLHQPLKRIINTSSQASLNAAERRKNIRNAFRYEATRKIRSVAIIDDVVTTGSTANEIAKTLKKAGVERVEVWAFARA
ncbi:MAG: ComF family protein [Cycloclasticus sp.]|nr:ComF family protein [Cycloclasticus sp.]